MARRIEMPYSSATENPETGEWAIHQSTHAPGQGGSSGAAMNVLANWPRGGGKQSNGGSAMAAGIPGLSMQDFASAGMARPSRQYRSMYERAGSTLDADSAALADQYAAYRAAQQAQGMANDAMYRSRMVEDRGFGEDARRFDLGRDDAMRRDTEAGRQFDSRMNVLRAILGGTTQPYAAAPSAPGGGVDVSMRGGAGYGGMGRGRGDGALRGQLNNYLAALLGGR